MQKFTNNGKTIEVVPHITLLKRVTDTIDHIVNTRSLSTDDLYLISDVFEQLACIEAPLRYIISSLDERELLSVKFIDKELDIKVSRDEISLVNSNMYSCEQYTIFSEALAQVISYSKDGEHTNNSDNIDNNSDSDSDDYEDESEGYEAESPIIMVCSPTLKYVEIWVNIDPESCRVVDNDPSGYHFLRTSCWSNIEVENPLDLFVGEGGYVVSRT